MNGNWVEKPLGEVIKLSSGSTPSKSNISFWGKHYPWISAKDLKTFYISDSEDKLSHEGWNSTVAKTKPGTTLILTRGMTLVKDVPVCITKTEASFNQDIKAITPKNSTIEPEFIPYLLLGNKQKLHSLVDLAGHGTGRIQTTSLLNLPIKIPPKSQQKWIANFFKEIDDKIELNRRINQTLEEIAQAIFKSWFVDFEPVKAKQQAREAGKSADEIERVAMATISGSTIEQLYQLPEEKYQKLAETAALFPDEFENSELGLIPKGWNVSTIGEEVETVGGGTPSTKNPAFWEEGTINWVTPKDLSGLSDKVLLSTSRKITQEGLAKISSGLLPIDTVLMSSRAPVGYLALTKIETAINQGFIAMKCYGRLPPEYVLQWTSWNINSIKNIASGSTFAEISKKTFRPFPILIPNVELLTYFQNYTRLLYEQIKENISQSDSLAQMRDILLPKLVTGDIDLGDLING